MNSIPEKDSETLRTKKQLKAVKKAIDVNIKQHRSQIIAYIKVRHKLNPNFNLKKAIIEVTRQTTQLETLIDGMVFNGMDSRNNQR